MAFRKIVDFIQVDVIVAMVIDSLRAKNVAMNVVSTWTQAQLGQGSSYKVPGIVDMNVIDYNGTAFTPQDAVSTYVRILIDKYPVIPFYLEGSDVSEANALSVAMVWAERAAEQIASKIDKDVFTTIEGGATASATILGSTGAPITVTTGTQALDYVEAFVTTLREANVEDNTAIVVPHYLGLKVAGEIGRTVNAQDLATQGIQAGYINTIFGVDLYESNNLPTTSGVYSVVGGKRDDFALIMGLTSVDSGDSEFRMASYTKMGQVYGAGFVNSAAWYKGAVKKS